MIFMTWQNIEINKMINLQKNVEIEYRYGAMVQSLPVWLCRAVDF